MIDNEFVVRVAHIIMSDKLWEQEKLILIRLSYLEMEFPEEVAHKEVYNRLMEKLYGGTFP